MQLPQIKLTAEVSALKGQPPVVVSCYFLASRPLDQQALDAFHAARPLRPAPDGDTDEAALQKRENNARLSAALCALFDASCVGVEITAPGDRDPRPATVADVAGDAKSAMALRLIADMEVRINGLGQ